MQLREIGGMLPPHQMGQNWLRLCLVVTFGGLQIVVLPGRKLPRLVRRKIGMVLPCLQMEPSWRHLFKITTFGLLVIVVLPGQKIPPLVQPNLGEVSLPQQMGQS
jgi:hypothetical protein